MEIPLSWNFINVLCYLRWQFLTLHLRLEILTKSTAGLISVKKLRRISSKNLEETGKSPIKPCQANNSRQLEMRLKVESLDFSTYLKKLIEQDKNFQLNMKMDMIFILILTLFANTLILFVIKK